MSPLDPPPTEASQPAHAEPLGAKIRRRRKELGLTLDELAGRTGVSKPYLSLIETGRVANPPSDDKLRRIEHALGFSPAELVSQAHLQRTPRDVRAMLMKLMRAQDRGTDSGPPETPNGSLDLDAAYGAGVLQELVERQAGNVEPVRVNAVPVINKMSCGYPRDFTDLGYPPRHADAHVSCPDIDDADAFAARVFGDSMEPAYGEEDIVIFSPQKSPRHGDDCFVRFADGTTTFKRVFFEDDTNGRGVIRLQPRNEKYPPQTVPAEQVTGLYRAVYRYERVND
jgi:transcriptional regulator with XRE-family HTH domain